MAKESSRLLWYHRDELQSVCLLVTMVLFFSHSIFLSSITLTLILGCFGVLYAFRIVRITLRENDLHPLSTLWRRHVEARMIFTSAERSRIAVTLVACVILGILCIHRITLTLSIAGFETPVDLYWIEFLAWYWIVGIVMFGYLLLRAVSATETSQSLRSAFLEGLVASMFFYHGMPSRQRLVSFMACFLLGGLPTYAATTLHPQDPTAYVLASVLVFPIIILTLGGAWYVTRWHINPSFESLP